MRLTFLRDPLAGVRLLRMSFAISDPVSFAVLLHFFNPHEVTNLPDHSSDLRRVAFHDKIIRPAKAEGLDSSFRVFKLLDDGRKVRVFKSNGEVLDA